MEDRDFKPLGEDEARRIFSQILNALHYSHTQNVVHFDIKLDNIMIDSKTSAVKLIDFGLCNFISETSGDIFYNKVGSEEYCAPELLSSKTTNFSGIKADVWCLGIVLYALLCATFPYDLERRAALVKAGKKHPKHTYLTPVPEKAKDLINKMLTINPKKRPTIEQILSHPWLEKPRSISQRNIFKQLLEERRRTVSDNRRSVDVLSK